MLSTHLICTYCLACYSVYSLGETSPRQPVAARTPCYSFVHFVKAGPIYPPPPLPLVSPLPLLGSKAPGLLICLLCLSCLLFGFWRLPKKCCRSFIRDSFLLFNCMVLYKISIAAFRSKRHICTLLLDGLRQPISLLGTILNMFLLTLSLEFESYGQTSLIRSSFIQILAIRRQSLVTGLQHKSCIHTVCARYPKFVCACAVLEQTNGK